MTRWPNKPDDHELYVECAEYAGMGYSRSDTAAILGYSRPHFTRHVLPRIDPGNSIKWPSRGWSRAHREALADGVGRGEQWRENVRYAALNRRKG